MKLKYFIAVLFVAITACKKDAQKLSPGLEGTWELISSDGGWSGHHEYARGNGNIFTFNDNHYSQVIKSTDTTYQYAGTFKIYTGKPCDFAKKQTLIDFDNSGFASSFSLSEGRLTIGTTECIMDGGSSTYKKIR
ncbi:hypothetical protein [Parafilimonas terrae]|jgi:hypothetical protein|uniref:Lipocalin-like domain-containing protein n=1 Tax=Parafilimonas terrae TaxID=1465490 RepID=A0A1I5XMW6_9BACT|nr:hypothetical protein [Parafilimonas terrae]SFQ33250.1 hypothetical protein SAMN05444277_10953 [Parafilimonas terrae]